MVGYQPITRRRRRDQTASSFGRNACRPARPSNSSTACGAPSLMTLSPFDRGCFAHQTAASVVIARSSGSAAAAREVRAVRLYLQNRISKVEAATASPERGQPWQISAVIVPFYQEIRRNNFTATTLCLAYRQRPVGRRVIYCLSEGRSAGARRDRRLP